MFVSAECCPVVMVVADQVVSCISDMICSCSRDVQSPSQATTGIRSRAIDNAGVGVV